MSEFVETPSNHHETECEMDLRHELEMKELDEKIKLLMKQASKSKKTEVETQVYNIFCSISSKMTFYYERESK